jgi:RimJ/RimL family protein N-acetyltransferase
MMQLRPAAMTDASLLLGWRNDPQTRANSRDTEKVQPAEHQQWLAQTLQNSERQLYIAELDGTPVGTVRADWGGRAYELSWTTAPEHRRKGYGREMVRLLVAMLDAPVWAEIKEGNIASVHIAEAVGMRLVSTEGGFLNYTT